MKHTALGRFRHENVGLRAQPGQPVAGYMGDDRLGGHVWKFVSDGLYRPGDAAGNRRLLSSGKLYAARFHADGTGEWRLLDLVFAARSEPRGRAIPSRSSRLTPAPWPTATPARAPR